jgi:hypothetical protein
MSDSSGVKTFQSFGERISLRPNSNHDFSSKPAKNRVIRRKKHTPLMPFHNLNLSCVVFPKHLATELAPFPMNIAEQSLKHLRKLDRCGYAADGAWAAEPTALAVLALQAHQEPTASLRFADQLAAAQLLNGAVSTTGEQDSPAWTTSLAILAWLATGELRFQAHIKRAIEWSLDNHGKPAPKNPQIGHDPTLLGWSWAANTHSWMEPTCMFVIALKAGRLGEHPRAREGVRVVVDRLLSTGGSNFGSTVVLGQPTLPQVESTGLAMLALTGEVITDFRVEKSLRYLEQEISPRTTTASLCYGLMGLTAHNRRIADAESLLAAALEREITRGPSAFKLSLIALASIPDLSWIPTREGAVHA